MAYGTNEGLEQYFTDRGYPVPDETNAMERLRLAGSIFVDGLGWQQIGRRAVSRFPGRPSQPGQVRQWPRLEALDYWGNLIPANQVPPAVEHATYEAAYHEAQTPGALNAVIRSDERIVREKFGDIEFQYAEGVPGEVSAPIIPAVQTILHPVLNGGHNPYGITGFVV